MLALSSSYCFSDTLYGTTGNAAAGGFSWDMTNVLPNNPGLTVDGLLYQYSVEKDAGADLSVTIRNENALEPGSYVMEQTDDWSQLPGGNLIRRESFSPIPYQYWGRGEIVTEGEGTVLNANVRYTWKYDECFEPLSNPSCPGYENALYAYLLANGLLGEDEVIDPYESKEVQDALDNETEKEEEQRKEEDEQDKAIEELNGEANLAELADPSAFGAMTKLPENFNQYFFTIPGGTYSDVIVLQDSTLPDNKRAMRNLAGDETHRKMIRSQYE